jgi:hypothetical protein
MRAIGHRQPYTPAPAAFAGGRSVRMPPPMLRRPTFLLPCAFLLAACGTVTNWQEMHTGPMSQADVYDAVDFLAQGDGYLAGPECDRGLGVWLSRWRQRVLLNNHPARFRLRVEVLIDKGTAQTGWTILYAVEQQKVKDLGKSVDPAEEDWSADGQDGEREFIFGQRLALRLGVRKLPGAHGDKTGPPAANSR